jgi:hypothetical protein
MRTAKILTLLLVIVISGLDAGLQGTETSRIAGLVLDANDARIVGATIKTTKAGFQREVTTDDEGRFEVEVTSGAYDLTVEQPGFRKFYFSKLQVGERTCELVNIHMEVGKTNSVLRVDSETPAKQ